MVYFVAFIQEKWANFHGSWGKRAAEPDYEEIDAAIEQLIPIQQVRALCLRTPRLETGRNILRILIPLDSLY